MPFHASLVFQSSKGAEARPKGRPEGSAIEGYVVEDHADSVLGGFTAQAEAIKPRCRDRFIVPKALPAQTCGCLWRKGSVVLSIHNNGWFSTYRIQYWGHS
jgi:hypothetical protein